MQPIGGVDPQAAAPQGTNFIETGQAATGGKVVLHNLSPVELLLTFGEDPNDPNRKAFLLAWQPREFDFCGKYTPKIWYEVYTVGGAGATPPTDYPSSWFFGEAYAPGENPPTSHPNYDRLSNVGNSVTTTGSSGTMKNDNNSPGTQIIEATPSDQTSSSLALNNDGSGTWQVLSANALKVVLQVTRGNNTTTKAVITLGDSSDTSITTFYGTIGTGSVVPAGTISGSVANATSLGGSLSGGNLGASPSNKPVLKTNQTSGSTYDFYVQTWDGTAAHSAMLMDHTGLRYSDAAGVQPGQYPQGRYVHVAPTAPASPDTIRLYDSNSTNSMNMGVSVSGDSVNAPGGYLWDAVHNGYIIKGGLVQAPAIAPGNVQPGIYGFYAPASTGSADVQRIVTSDGSQSMSIGYGLSTNSNGAGFYLRNTTDGTYLMRNSKLLAAALAAGAVGAGAFTFTSPANGTGTPDTLIVNDGAGGNPLTMGVSKTGDTVNVPGSYLYDSLSSSFMVKGGKLQPAALGTGTVGSVLTFNNDQQMSKGWQFNFGGNTATAPNSPASYVGLGTIGTENEMEIVSIGQNLKVMTGTSAFVIANNCYFNGTSDLFVSAANNAYQVEFGVSGPRIRYSTNTPTAGGTITWGSWFNLVAGYYGSAAPSFTNFPAGSAAWFNSAY